jgi:beta-N-acetylhexosaminidase
MRAALPRSPTPPSTTPQAPPPTCAELTLNQMTNAERAGQLFMLGVGARGLGSRTEAVLAEVHPGAIILVGGTRGGSAAVREVVDTTVRAAGAPYGATPFVAADQEGGLVQRLKGPGFSTIPSARRQVTLGHEQLAVQAHQWGSELRTAGVTLDLAPVSDVVPPGQRNEPIADLRRGYGTNPADVAAYVRAFVAGMSHAGVATSLKHFPGLGNVVGNTDFTADVVDRVTTRGDPALAPFAAGIAAGAPFLMVSLATYTEIDPENPAVFSPTVIDGMVRGDLGFGGVVLTDDIGNAAAVQSVSPAERALRFLHAGGDMVLTVDAAAGLTMWRAVVADPTLQHRIDAAALRVLRAKERFGLLHCPTPR